MIGFWGVFENDSQSFAGGRCEHGLPCCSLRSPQNVTLAQRSSTYVLELLVRRARVVEKQGRLACQPGAVVNFHHISNALERQSGHESPRQNAASMGCRAAQHQTRHARVVHGDLAGI